MSMSQKITDMEYTNIAFHTPLKPWAGRPILRRAQSDGPGDRPGDPSYGEHGWMNGSKVRIPTCQRFVT